MCEVCQKAPATRDYNLCIFCWLKREARKDGPPFSHDETTP